MNLQLTGKTPENQDAVSFSFKSESPFEFKPGQFMRYHIPNQSPDERGENRFFSISAAPFENKLMITTRINSERGSTFKKDLSNLKIGDSISAEGPKGSFTLEDPNLEYVFIAGGIGITPFRSILLQLDHERKPINITLLYANRVENPVYFKAFEEIAKRNPNFKIHYFIGERKIDKQAIKELVPDLKKPLFYISGPEPMVEEFEDMLGKIGIPKENIETDYFPGYTQY